MDIPCKTLDSTLEYPHEVPRRLSWKAIAGSVKALVGSYTFDAIDGGKRTRVTYKLALDPGFSTPSMIKKATTKLIVGTALSDLRKYTEKPDTQEQAQKLVDAQDATPPAQLSRDNAQPPQYAVIQRVGLTETCTTDFAEEGRVCDYLMLTNSAGGHIYL